MPERNMADQSVSPINALTGLLRQAAIAKAARQSQLDALETAALGGGGAGVQPQAPAAHAGAMPQSQFGGPPKSPQQQMLEQQG